MHLPLRLLGVLLLATSAVVAQQSSFPSSGLPDAPSAVLLAQQTTAGESSSAAPVQQEPTPVAPPAATAVDANGVPLETRQPTRILGIMPNFRSVSGGVKPHPLGWKYNARVATDQAFDYSSFISVSYTHLTLPTNREV